VAERNYNNIIALIPALLMGLSYFGVPALGVICLAVSSAIGWELLLNYPNAPLRWATVMPPSSDCWFWGMLLPATAPFWLVITGTFLAIVIGKQIFGGIGANPFCPPALAYAILMVSWKTYMDFDAQLIHFDFDFTPIYGSGAAMKAFGPEAVANVSLDLLIGRQVGGIGATSGLALILGGVYLMHGVLSAGKSRYAFIAGLFLTAAILPHGQSAGLRGPFFHLFTGFALIGAFFLATELQRLTGQYIPMLDLRRLGGFMTILIRNIGVYVDGVIFAILLINLINPLVDKIRPKGLERWRNDG
jgi:electron transport complex protein RnfD